MLKKDIQYTDPNGVQQTKTCWFHLTKAQILKLELLTPGGDFAKHIQALAENVANEPKPLIDLFEKLIHMAYGERVGVEFMKSDQLSDHFLSTEAYSELFFELCTSPNAASNFVNGIMPGDIENAFKPSRPVPQDRKPKQLRVVENVELPTEDDVENVFDNYDSSPTAPMGREIDYAAMPLEDGFSSKPAHLGEQDSMSEFEAFKAWKAQQDS